MAKLFKSDRVFIDGSFFDGSILVNSEGKIEEVFTDPTTMNEWLRTHAVPEVN